MKKILFLMLGLVAGIASFANPITPTLSTPHTRVVMTADHKLKLYVEPLHTKGQVSIQDAHGQAVYSSTVALQKGLYQQLDFSDLSTGTYQLTLKAGDQFITKKFVVQANPNSSFIIQEP